MVTAPLSRADVSQQRGDSKMQQWHLRDQRPDNEKLSLPRAPGKVGKCSEKGSENRESASTRSW